MNSYTHKPRSQPSYTITNAKQDIEHLNTCFGGLETSMKHLHADVDSFRNDEWRALHLCGMLIKRMNVLEMLLLEALKPEGQQYLTHAVMTQLRKEQKGATA